jgi:galactokinase
MQETAIPISDPDVAVIITNSNVKRSLAQSAYAERLEQCQSAAKALGKSSLRDASENDVEGKILLSHSNNIYELHVTELQVYAVFTMNELLLCTTPLQVSEKKIHYSTNVRSMLLLRISAQNKQQRHSREVT